MSWVADAVPGKATGKVGIGGQSATAEQNNAFALANSVATDDGIFTEGTAGMHALTFDGILDIFNVSSYASLTRDGSGHTVPVTTTNLGTISFAGLTSGATGDGLTAFGSAPTPLSVEGLAALNEALKPSGISLTYLPEIYAYTDGSTSSGPTVNEKKDVSGVMSGALQLFFTNTSERGTTTETITIGRVSLTATSTSLGAGAADSGAVLGADSAGAPGAALPATGTGAVDAAGLDGAALGGVVPGAAPALTGTAATGQLPTQTFLPAAASGAFGIGTTSFESSFLFIALGAALALAGAQVVRLVAVRGR